MAGKEIGDENKDSEQETHEQVPRTSIQSDAPLYIAVNKALRLEAEKQRLPGRLLSTGAQLRAFLPWKDLVVLAKARLWNKNKKQ